MSIVGTAVRMTHDLTRKVARVIVHPVEAAAGAADLAGNAATTVLDTFQDRGKEPADWTLTPHPDAEAMPEEEPVPRPDPVEPSPPVATEPKPSDVDDWQDELAAEDEDEEDEGLDLGPAPDGPLLDPAVAKSVRTETETLRRAADRDAEG